MKKIVCIALSIVPAIVFAQSNQFKLNGKIENTDSPVKVYLSYRSANKNLLDSTRVKGGRFQFQGTIPAPLKAVLLFDHSGTGLNKSGRTSDMLSLYLDQGEMVVSTKDSVKTATITGSKTNNENAAYIKSLAGSSKAIAAINAEYAAAPGDKKKDPEFTKYIRSKFDQALQNRTELQYAYVKQNPDSFVSLDVLTEITGPGLDLAKVEPLYKAFSENVKNNPLGINMAENIEKARATATGAMAPLFTQNDVNDKPVNLADFRGKYVLLDFWASWCAPCRAENPNVVKAYNIYKNEAFTVLGVSLDQPGKKDAWLAAIKADGLEWTQVSDLKFWSNEAARKYNIRSIPQNFLIDPNGKIIGKDLRGEALISKLKEIFGS